MDETGKPVLLTSNITIFSDTTNNYCDKNLLQTSASLPEITNSRAACAFIGTDMTGGGGGQVGKELLPLTSNIASSSSSMPGKHVVLTIKSEDVAEYKENLNSRQNTYL